jgi:hypothetical protein
MIDLLVVVTSALLAAFVVFVMTFDVEGWRTVAKILG